jgi:hypothetical protein
MSEGVKALIGDKGAKGDSQGCGKASGTKAFGEPDRALSRVSWIRRKPSGGRAQ